MIDVTETNWPAFGIIVVLLVIIPLWILDFANFFGIFTKIVFTLVLIVFAWWIATYGKAKGGP